MSTALPKPPRTSGKSIKLPESNADLIALAGRLKSKADAAAAAYAEVADAIKARLSEGKWTTGGVVVKVEPNNRVNKDKIIEECGDEVMSMQFDTALAHKVLGNRYQDFMQVVGYKITTTVTDEIPD